MSTRLSRKSAAYQNPAWDQSASTAASKGWYFCLPGTSSVFSSAHWLVTPAAARACRVISR